MCFSPVRTLRQLAFAPTVEPFATVGVSQALERFFADVLPKFRHPIVLVTFDYNSDRSAPKPFETDHSAMLDHPLVAHWFSDNWLQPPPPPPRTCDSGGAMLHRKSPAHAPGMEKMKAEEWAAAANAATTPHPKLTVLPIGINDRHVPDSHGDRRLLMARPGPAACGGAAARGGVRLPPLGAPRLVEQAGLRPPRPRDGPRRPCPRRGQRQPLLRRRASPQPRRRPPGRQRRGTASTSTSTSTSTNTSISTSRRATGDGDDDEGMRRWRGSSRSSSRPYFPSCRHRPRRLRRLLRLRRLCCRRWMRGARRRTRCRQRHGPGTRRSPSRCRRTVTAWTRIAPEALVLGTSPSCAAPSSSTMVMTTTTTRRTTTTSRPRAAPRAASAAAAAAVAAAELHRRALRGAAGGGRR